MRFLVDAGGSAGKFPEGSDEAAYVAEARIVRGRTDALLAPVQELLDTFDPPGRQILQRAQPHMVLEGPAEMILAQAGFPGKAVETDLTAEVRFDEPERPGDLKGQIGDKPDSR